MSSFSNTQIALLSLLALPVVYIVIYNLFTPSSRRPTPTVNSANESEEKTEDEPKSVMSPENTDLAPPKDDPFTLEQLKAYDGNDPSKPIYVSIKGMRAHPPTSFLPFIS